MKNLDKLLLHEQLYPLVFGASCLVLGWTASPLFETLSMRWRVPLALVLLVFIVALFLAKMAASTRAATRAIQRQKDAEVLQQAAEVEQIESLASPLARTILGVLLDDPTATILHIDTFGSAMLDIGNLTFQASDTDRAAHQTLRELRSAIAQLESLGALDTDGRRRDGQQSWRLSHNADQIAAAYPIKTPIDLGAMTSRM